MQITLKSATEEERIEAVLFIEQLLKQLTPPETDKIEIVLKNTKND